MARCGCKCMCVHVHAQQRASTRAPTCAHTPTDAHAHAHAHMHAHAHAPPPTHTRTHAHLVHRLLQPRLLEAREPAAARLQRGRHALLLERVLRVQRREAAARHLRSGGWGGWGGRWAGREVRAARPLVVAPAAAPAAPGLALFRARARRARSRGPAAPQPPRSSSPAAPQPHLLVQLVARLHVRVRRHGDQRLDVGHRGDRALGRAHTHGAAWWQRGGVGGSGSSPAKVQRAAAAGLHCQLGRQKAGAGALLWRARTRSLTVCPMCAAFTPRIGACGILARGRKNTSKRRSSAGGMAVPGGAGAPSGPAAGCWARCGAGCRRVCGWAWVGAWVGGRGRGCGSGCACIRALRAAAPLKEPM